MGTAPPDQVLAFGRLLKGLVLMSLSEGGRPCCSWSAGFRWQRFTLDQAGAAGWQGLLSVVAPASCTGISRGDDVDAVSARYFVNSSLAPVLFLRRRIKSC